MGAKGNHPLVQPVGRIPRNALQTFTVDAETLLMEGSNHKGKPFRRCFGVLAALTAAADLAVAAAVPDNAYRIPTVDDSIRPFVVGYGVFLGMVAVWAVATSFAKRSRRSAAPAQVAPLEEDVLRDPNVLHELRRQGWFIADDIRLDHADIDHVAVGPAGVLAVQTMRTDVQDPRGKPAARARIAAQQLRNLLAQKEIAVDVVPAVVAWGPGLESVPGGVKIIDSCAILFGHQADEWLSDLSGRELLPEETVSAVRFVLSDMLEGVPAELAGARTPSLV